MYNYKAVIKNVVDGDTVDAEVDVGFSISVKHRFRIEGFDAPESWRPKTDAEREHGERAKLMAIELLLNKTVMMNTYKLDIYGRYSADIILPDGRDFATVMIELGLVKLEAY